MKWSIVLTVLLTLFCHQAQAEQVLLRKRGKAYVEAPREDWKGESIRVWTHDGRSIGKFKILRYLEHKDVLVLKDRRGKLEKYMDVTFEKPKRRPASIPQKWSYGVYGGAGAGGPFGKGYIETINPGVSLGGFALYRLNHKWDLQVALQYSKTTGTGEASDSATATRFFDTWTANFDYKIEGSIAMIKIPVTLNYNYNRNWIFRAGGFVDLVQSADYKASLKIKDVEGSFLSLTFNEEQTLQDDITDNLNSSVVGLTTGVSYVHKKWRFNLDGGISFGESFKSGIVIDEVKVGEVLGLEITETNIELEKSSAKNAFAQLTISYMF